MNKICVIDKIIICSGSILARGNELDLLTTLSGFEFRHYTGSVWEFGQKLISGVS